MICVCGDDSKGWFTKWAGKQASVPMENTGISECIMQRADVNSRARGRVALLAGLSGLNSAVMLYNILAN